MLQGRKGSNKYRLKIPRFHAHPKLFKQIQYKKNVRFIWIYLGFEDFDISKIYPESTIAFLLFSKTIAIDECFGLRNIFRLWRPQASQHFQSFGFPKSKIQKKVYKCAPVFPRFS